MASSTGGGMDMNMNMMPPTAAAVNNDVSFDMFGKNRDKLVKEIMMKRKNHHYCTDNNSNSNNNNNNKNNNGGAAGAAVVCFLQGGPSETRFDSDHEPIFRQESYFAWLTGVKEPDCAVSIFIHSNDNNDDNNNGVSSSSSSSSAQTTTTATTCLYIPRLLPEYATVMGHIKSCEEWKEHYQVDQVLYMDQAQDHLIQLLTTTGSSSSSTTKRATAATETKTETLPVENGIYHKENGMKNSNNNNNNNTHHHDILSPNHNGNCTCSSTLYLMKGTNSDSGKEYQPPTNEFLKPILAYNNKINNNDDDNDSDNNKIQIEVDTRTLFPILANCRVIKSQEELSLLQWVTELTSWAHAYTMQRTHPTMKEYQSEALFRFYCYYTGGARHLGYTAICGCGPNASILHYGHAGEPNGRTIADGDLCLFDMGAEYSFYGSDVTCTFPANGKFTPRQAAIYSAVLDAQRAVYAMIRPGVSWVDCHKAAEAAILRALVDIGIVVLSSSSSSSSSSSPTATATTTTIEELVEMRLGAIFMPHGLGHLIGIDTHDVGGYLPDHTPPRIQKPGLKSLRTARILEANMTLTVEPGCYFIDHLIDEALEGPSSPFKQYLNAELLKSPEYYRGFGGVRLEDVVVVTNDGCINYTLCPRTIEEVEHVVNGGKWPPLQDAAPELRRERLTDPIPAPLP